MSTKTSVRGYRRPLVIEHPGSRLAEVHHRLDGQYHAFPQFRTLSAGAEIGDLRLFVQLGSDPVSHELSHHAETVGLHVLLDSRPHIADRISNQHLLNALVE